MYIEAVILPLIVGKIRGGKITNLTNFNIRLLWLLLMAGLLESIASFIRAKEINPIWPYIEEYKLMIQLIVYLLLFIAIIYNRKERGFTLILVGLILNFIVIMANGGQMPVDVSRIIDSVSSESIAYLSSGKNLVHTLADENTKFWILGDIIHILRPYPFPKSISIGDIFLIAGLAIAIYRNMFPREAQKTL